MLSRVDTSPLLPFVFSLRGVFGGEPLPREGEDVERGTPVVQTLDFISREKIVHDVRILPFVSPSALLSG